MGIIFDIQKCCLYDGPGIRTTVFLKGCNLRCKWCHNPESFHSLPELFLQSNLCTSCGKCVAACEKHVHSISGTGSHLIDRKDCTACGRCVEECPNDALRIYGREMSAQRVFSEIEKDARFYHSSGGGVTFSGGEAALQMEFLIEILDRCKDAGYHTALETNGSLPWAKLESLLPLVDLFLFDYKHSDSRMHLHYTGVSNERILENLRMLKKSGATIWLRCPIIPSVNDTQEHFSVIAALKQELQPEKVEIMAYHDIGKGKWNGLGLDYAFQDVHSVSPEVKAGWEKQVHEAKPL